MENALLSSSYPSAFRSSVLDDITKSRLDSDSLAESWSLGVGQMNSNLPSIEVPIAVTTQTVTSNIAGDLHSLAWLQKDCILNIAPLDSEDIGLHSHEVVVTADSSPERMSPDSNVVRLSNSLSSLQSLSSFRSHQHNALLNGENGGNKSSETPSLSASMSEVGLRHSHGSNVYSNILGSHSSHHHHNSGSSGDGGQSRQLGTGNDGSTAYPPSIVGTRRPPKPAYSYTHLIFMAIESTLHKCMTVNEIYNWCETHFPYFKSAGAGWKNSLRHNLSINKCFKRIPRDGRGESSMTPSTSDPKSLGSANNHIIVNDSSDNNDDENEGPGRGAFWTVESKERAQLLEAVRRNPWTFNTALTVHNGNTTAACVSAVVPHAHHQGGSASLHTGTTAYRTGLISASATATLLDVSYSQRSSAGGFLTCSGGSTSSAPSLSMGGSGGGVVVNGSAPVEEDSEAKQYASLLRSLHNSALDASSLSSPGLPPSTVEGKANGYHHHYHPYHRGKHGSKEYSKMSNGSHRNSTGSDTEFSDARLPSRSEMPLLHKTMKKMLLGHKKAQSDNDSDSQMTERDMQGVMDLVNLQNSGVGSESSSEREKCNECKENVQGCEACLARGTKRTACYVTPAPCVDHEYARFQSVLRPSRGCPGELEGGGGGERGAGRRKPPLRRSSATGAAAVVKEEVDTSSDEEGEGDDRTEPMSQPAYLADLEEMSDTDSEVEDDEKTQTSAAQILVEFSRLKRFQQQSGYWTSDSSPEKSVSE